MLQRANEITQRLKIDDQPEYDLDMSSPRAFGRRALLRMLFAAAIAEDAPKGVLLLVFASQMMLMPKPPH